MRSTRTDLHEFPALTRIDGCWTGHDGDKKNVHLGPGGTPVSWTGETWFQTIAPKHPDRRQIFIGGQIVQQTSATPRPNTVLPLAWNMAGADMKKKYLADSRIENKNRDDARAAREYPWERVPFEDCATTCQFNLAHMSFNKRFSANTSNGGCSEAESSEEYVGCEEDGWHVCHVCGKFAEHWEMKDPVFTDLPELDIRLQDKDKCVHARRPCTYACGNVPKMSTADGQANAVIGEHFKKKNVVKKPVPEMHREKEGERGDMRRLVWTQLLVPCPQGHHTCRSKKDTTGTRSPG